ncbi:hypothetical protein Droror1_Dr00005012 [Drosera rotundifolia]
MGSRPSKLGTTSIETRIAEQRGVLNAGHAKAGHRTSGPSSAHRRASSPSHQQLSHNRPYSPPANTCPGEHTQPAVSSNQPSPPLPSTIVASRRRQPSYAAV